MPRVSIIQATYGHEKFISSSIRSVLDQEFADWELLTGDDASVDDTLQKARNMASNDPRIQIWRHEKNLGLVANLEFLLKKVSKDSEYVAFLEWDDEFEPDNLLRKIALFEEDESLGIVISSHSNMDAFWAKISGNGFVVNALTYNPKLRIWGPHQVSASELLEMLGNPIKSFGSIMIRKSVLEKIWSFKSPNGDSMFWPFDYYLWLQLLPSTTYWNIETPLLRYRVHSNNFSSRKNATKFIRQTLSGLERLEKIGTFSNFRQDDLSYKFAKEYYLSLLEFLDGRKLSALKHLSTTFKYRPVSRLFVRMKLLFRITFSCFI